MEKHGQEVGGKSHITRVQRDPKTDCAGGVEQNDQLRMVPRIRVELMTRGFSGVLGYISYFTNCLSPRLPS